MHGKNTNGQTTNRQTNSSTTLKIEWIPERMIHYIYVIDRIQEL